MSLLETKSVQAPIIKWARERGILAIRFTPYGEKGWPDWILVLPNGKVLWVEFKKPEEEKPEPLQEYRHEQLRDYGQIVYVINDRDEGIKTIEAELDST